MRPFLETHVLLRAGNNLGIVELSGARRFVDEMYLYATVGQSGKEASRAVFRDAFDI